jgi:hypothetical protein
MSDGYEAWKLARSRAEAPPDFADRVMAAVRAHGVPRRSLLSSRLVRCALWLLAALALAVRVLAVLALFHPS